MKIQITTNGIRDDEALTPTIPTQAYEYLLKSYGTEFLVSANRFANNDEHMGYIKGVLEVLGKLKQMQNIRGDE
jgi:hypothetical protein